MDHLTDATLNQAVTSESRTIGRLAWHIVTTIPEMITRTGLEFGEVQHDAPVPSTAADIAKAYKSTNDAMSCAIKENWTDATLSETYDMYGQEWQVATILQVLVFHQIHHRGQLTVLTRQAGLVIPGIYGPSFEEWESFGMAAPII